jgi:CheY-like chemotaxis protein
MEPRTDQQSGRRRILVVDGDAQIQRLLDVNLRAAGFEVQAVGTATEGLAALAATAPDLIVSETRFASGVDGFDFCRKVKAPREVGALPIPFVFLTEPSVDAKVKGVEAGVDDFLPKPLYVQEVVARVRALLQRREHDRLEALARGEERFVGEIEVLPLVDLLRSIQANRRSGVAHLAAPTGARGDIYFRDGGVVDAEVGRLSGLDALCRLFSWTEGAFEIEWKSIRRKDAVAMEPGALLMEALRRLDDWRRLLAELPSVDTVFEVDYHLLAERLAEIPDEVNSILRLFDGQRTLMRVIDDCGFSDLDALAVIGKLYREQIVRDARLRPEPSLAPGADVEGWIADAVGPFRGLAGRERRDLFGPTPDAVPASVHARVTAPVEPLEDSARDVVAEERRERFTDRLIAEASPPEAAPAPMPAASSGPTSGPIMAPETTRMGLGLMPPPSFAPAPAPAPPPVKMAPETTRMGLGLTPPLPMGIVPPPVAAPPSAPAAPPAALPPAVNPPPMRAADTQLGLSPAPLAPPAFVPPSTLPPKTNPETTQQGLGMAAPLSTKPGFAAASDAPLPPPREARSMPADVTPHVEARAGAAPEPKSADGVPQPIVRPAPEPGIVVPPPGAPAASAAPPPSTMAAIEPRTVAGEILARASTELMEAARTTADQAGGRRTDLGLGPEPLKAASGELAAPPPREPPKAAEPPRKKIILDPEVPEEEEVKGLSRGLKLGIALVVLAVPAVVAVVALKKTDRRARHEETTEAAEVEKKKEPVAAAPAPAPAPVVDAQAPPPVVEAAPAPVAAAPAASPPRPHGSSHKPSEAPASSSPTSPVVDERVADPKVARALPTEFQQLLGACRTAFGEKRAKDAEIACLAAKDANPDSPEASALYAHALFNRKKRKEAMQWAERALQLNANEAEAYVIIGGVKQANDDARGAKAAYKKYLELAPTGQYAADLRAIVDSL